MQGNEDKKSVLEERLFQLVGFRPFHTENISIRGRTLWKDSFHRFTKNIGAVIGSSCIIILVFLAVFGPKMNDYKYDKVDLTMQNLSPRIPVIEKLGIFDGTNGGIGDYEDEELSDTYHFFGTDSLGRDLWTRVFLGTRISLYIALVAVAIDVLLGITYGVISGYYGGMLDIFMQRILEVLQGLPTVVIVTLLMLVLEPGLISIIFALIFASWINMSHVVRAQVLKLKETEYVMAAKTMGESDLKIILKEILPNMLGQVIILAMMSVPEAIFLEAYLSFIGLGIPDPLASLGSLINSGYGAILSYPYMVAIPVVIFAVLMISFNLVADGLRDVFDPALKEM